MGMNPKKTLGLIAKAMMKQKESLGQLLGMTGILGLSVRCLGHKYRIRDLEEETSALRMKQVSLTRRMKRTKRALLREASLDSTGLSASRLHTLFSQDKKSITLPPFPL